MVISGSYSSADARYLLALIFLGALAIGGILYFVSQNRSKAKRARLRAVTMANVDKMTGHEFEAYVHNLLQAIGFRDVRQTPSSRDFGADIIASSGDDRYSIQVKRCGPYRKANLKAVQEAVGAMSHYRCNRSMVITNRTYEMSAITLAQSSGTVLIDREQLGVWILSLDN